MPAYDFFDFTGISLTEKIGARVKRKLESKIDDINSRLASEPQESIRYELQEQIRFLKDIKAKILNDERLTSEFYSMVEKKTEELKRRLEARILLEIDSRKGRELVITMGKIHKIKNTSGISLTLDYIKKAYTEKKFRIDTISPLDDFPKIFDKCDEIHRELDFFRERVRKARELNSSYEEAEHVKNLYTFAAYVCGDSINAANYALFSVEMLKKKLEPCRMNYATYNSETVENCEANIANMAVSFIFSSEENKRGYDQYLLLQTPELAELFTTMSGLIESDLKDADIAELCIGKIQEVLRDLVDRKTAIAIYNKKANLINDPYIPDRAVFTVRCAHCQAMCEFSSLSEAQTLNKCTKCGEKLYKLCPSCKKFVLFSMYRCPECGYYFPDKAKFDRHIVIAEDALRRKNFSYARDNLLEARIADPTEEAKIKALDERITREEREYNKPVDDLNSMIDGLRFEEAEKYSERILRLRLELDISLQVRKIRSVLEDCRRTFQSARDRTTKINSCLDILDKCIDFSPALNFLADNPPAPCPSVNIYPDDEASALLLSWTSSGERRIKYTLLRKIGSKPPANEKDGDIILMDSEELSYKDTKIESGLIYSYSVFAHRQKLFSVPSSASGVVLAKISDFQCRQKGTSLHLSWKNPANCSKVNVSFQHKESEKVIASGFQSSSVIENVEFGTKYVFILSANYPGLGQSRKTIREFTPSAEIKDFRISSRRVGNNIYEISWDIKESGVDIQILSEQEICEIRSEMRACQISLKENRYYVIRAKALSGGEFKSSTNEININTYSPCVIDEEKTEIRENGNNINISVALSGNIPDNLKYVAYFVRDNDKDPSESEVLSPTSGCEIIYAEGLKRNGKKINITVPPKGSSKIFVTIFAVYQDGGSERISAPCKKMFIIPLFVKVFWKIRRRFFGIFGNKYLVVRFKANRPLLCRPAFVLCKSKNRKPVLNPSDINADTILEKKTEETLSGEKSEISCNFEIEQKLANGQELFLFIRNTRVDESYDAPRWEEGFNGRA